MPQTSIEDAAALGKKSRLTPEKRRRCNKEVCSEWGSRLPTPDTVVRRNRIIRQRRQDTRQLTRDAQRTTPMALRAQKRKAKSPAQCRQTPNPNLIPPHSTIETQHLQSESPTPKTQLKSHSHVPPSTMVICPARSLPAPSSDDASIHRSSVRQGCQMRWGWQHSRTLAPDLRSALPGAVPPARKRGTRQI